MAGDLSDHDLAAYDYELPPGLVAQEPLARRDASRLLVLDLASGLSSYPDTRLARARATRLRQSGHLGQH